MIAWKPKFSSFVSYYVIATIENDGPTWAQLDTFGSDYTIYDGSGGVTTTGSFTYAYPDFVAPGATGYLIEDGDEDGFTVVDFATVDVDGRYSDADGPPSDPLEVSNTSLHASFGNVVEATGEVTNTGSEAADSAHAGAIYFNAAGDIIGVSYTNLIENVSAGEKKGFKTIESNPLKIGDIDHYLVIASADPGF